MQEKYQVLARKYRPKSFEQVLAQDSIVTTLKNALKQNKAAHAYLFTGPRGVGKTSLARLFAKALNCERLSADFEPCNTCPSCAEINSGQSLDILEVDGASNRGIDDIRQINETVGYAPSRGKYKIYIIDEVHMLTKEAFNALLKTLEEPPEMVKFFFATTEPQKVLPTISSRCQRFDLLRISEKALIQKLQTIVKELGREADIDALTRISLQAEGSFRDAESLLDQVLCYTDTKVSLAVVIEALGLIDRQIFFDLDKAVWSSNIPFAFEFSDQIFRSGKDLVYLLEELIEHYRQILVAIMRKEPKESLSEEYQLASEKYTSEQCLYILDLLLQASRHLHRSPLKRITIEMLLLQILRSQKRVSLEKITQKLLDLENSAPSFGAPTPKEPTLQEPAAPKQPEPEPVPVPIPRDTTPEPEPVPIPIPRNTAPETKPAPVKQADSFVKEKSQEPATPKQPEPVPIPIPRDTAPEPTPLKQTDLLEQEEIIPSAPKEPKPIQGTVPVPTPAPAEAPQSEAKKSQDKKDKSHYDTLMRFAAVELEGTIQH